MTEVGWLVVGVTRNKKTKRAACRRVKLLLFGGRGGGIIKEKTFIWKKKKTCARDSKLFLR